MFDTIVAAATPAARSALAVVRIDGPDALRIGETLSGRSLQERHASLVRLTHDGGEIDEAVVTRFVAPHSFTGNDLIEMSLHGNPLLVSELLRAVVSLGARMAEPGEFSERAVLNGRIDLLQAEAIRELIDARTMVQARLALSQVEGALSRRSASVRFMLLDVISRLEAALDFSEEGYDFIGRTEAVDLLATCMAELTELVRTFDRGRVISSGLTAVIAGQPNSGKSTLLNYLCGSERAIVTATPGTTRDLLRETIEVGGLPVTLVDTAGLRLTTDEIEAEGIARARRAAAEADFVIYLIDARRGNDPSDQAELQRWPDALVLYTKSDLTEAPAGALGISIPSGQGLARLWERLDQAVRERWSGGEQSAILVNERQRAAVGEALTAMAAASESLGNRASEEVVLVDLYAAANALGSLIGAITNEQVMSEIFGRFCIGK